MLNDYQEFTRTTAIYPKENALTYLMMGLCSEVGELAGKAKKHLREGNISRKDFESEIGDTIWYLVRIADELGVNLVDIVAANQSKLEGRKERGTITGSGDNR